MANNDPHTNARPISVEDRRARRAFSNAMRKGLQSTYDHVSSRNVPDDFFDLLRKADQKAGA